MPDLVAHFTPAEIPGTLAVLLLGISIGALLAVHREAARGMVLVVCSLVAFAALGYAGDRAGWPDGLRMAIDLTFLSLAVVLAAQALRRRT